MFGTSNNTTNATTAAQSYTDLNALNDVKKLGREKNPEAIMAVARQFESYFISQMMKEMRASVDVIGQDNFQNSSEMQFHQQMFDQQMSQELAKNGGYGLAETLARQLMEQYNLDWQEPESGIAATSQVLRSSQAYSPKQQVESNNDQAINTIDHFANKSIPENSSPTINRDNFIDVLSTLAERAAAKLGVDKRVLIAQAALETGWGEHITRNGEVSSHNLFNIKSDSRWQGESVKVTTLEYQQGVAEKELASFRAYPSFEESFNDYVEFIQQNPRYQQALNNASDNRAYLEHLQDAGYATDPEYSAKILTILQQPEFNQGNFSR